jgi:hypothetical protein
MGTTESRKLEKRGLALTAVQSWKIFHQHLVEIVTYRSFCEALQIPEEDIRRFDRSCSFDDDRLLNDLVVRNT